MPTTELSLFGLRTTRAIILAAPADLYLVLATWWDVLGGWAYDDLRKLALDTF